MKKFTSKIGQLVSVSLVLSLSFTSCSDDNSVNEFTPENVDDAIAKDTEDGRHVLSFKTFGGENKSMNLWGIGWVGNTAQNVSRMGGSQEVDFIRIGCPNEWPLVDDKELSAEAIAEMDKQLAAAEKAPNAQIGCVCSGARTKINSYYVDGDDFRERRWIKLFKAMKRHIESKGKQVAFIEIGNEQDFKNKIGSPSNINNIQQKMKTDIDFIGIPLVGPSPINAGHAQEEYDEMKNTLDWGATHAINGIGEKYINFVKQVQDDGKPYWGSEIHNLVEMLIGAEYGAIGGLWWSPIKVNQGLFQQYNQRGNRLGYTEVADTFSAAAAYRDDTQNNTIHLFLASKFGGEKFRIKIQNRDVSFNGGPLTKTYDIDLGVNEEVYIKLTW